MSPIRFLPRRAGLAALALASCLPAQSAFNLLSNQTPIRAQGGRNTCVTFAAIAALEAAHHRAGYGYIDLSEEFENYLGKMFWLHSDWSGITTADTTENQVGAFGGGGGTGHVRWLCNGMRVPIELRMPYRSSGYDLGSHPSWLDPHWSEQRNVNDFNLDRRNLPRGALTAPRYFSGSSVTMLQDPRSTQEIEAVLRSRREVVWDFRVMGDRSGPIWRVDSRRPPGGAHSMLIVGYDRSHPDPRQHYFICKNSWGPTSNPGGFTYIHYDYVRYGYSAACFNGIATPGPWEALAFVGRHNFCFDGWRGTLDVTHLPGMAQMWLDEAGVQIADRRVGTFFDHNGTAHRVNGRVIGNQLHFWFKGGYPNMRWDDQRESNTGLGRGFYYYQVDSITGELAGWHMDNAGLWPNPAYGGYARQPSTIHGTDGFLRPSFSNSLPWDPNQYIGRWDIQFANLSAQIVFEARDDSRVPQSLRGTWAGLRSFVVVEGARRSVTAMVKISSPRQLDLSFSLADGRQVSTDCQMLSHARGIFAGAASVDGETEGIYGVRRGSFRSGSVTSFGSGCGGSRGPVRLTWVGDPHYGGSIQLWFNGVGILPAALSFGTSRTRTTSGLRLPFALDSYGAPGCSLLVDPQVTLPLTPNGFGWASSTVPVDDPALIGVQTYSQVMQFDATANALGVGFSNGLQIRFGD